MAMGSMIFTYYLDRIKRWMGRKNRENPNLNYDHLVSFDAPVPHVGFHLLIRKDSQHLELMPKFDDTIRSMHEDGEIEKIKNKWIN
jgi:ABC-type amino acid transport substrate-binding protein